MSAYRWLGEAIARALRALGVGDVEVIGVERARAARGAPAGAADACFGGLSPFEVLAGGRKVVGLSQARRRPGALLQAGIPLALDSARLARLMARDGAFADALAATAAGVREFVPGLTAADLVAAVDAAVVDLTGARLVDAAPTEAERGPADPDGDAARDGGRLGSRGWTIPDVTGGASSSAAYTASGA